MAKNKNRRKDPMIALIIALVVLAALAAGAWYFGGRITDYRAELLETKQTEVELRNAEKEAAYNAELNQYRNEIASNQANKAWPAAKAEGWDVIDLTNYPLEAPGSVTVSREDVMYNGLLLVNEWHSRPADFDESKMVSIFSYAKDAGLETFWDDSSCKLHPVAIDALVDLIKDARALGYNYFTVRKGYNFRTYEEQNKLFQDELAYQRERRPNLKEEELIARAKAKVNYPGTSDYNSGLSCVLKIYVPEDGEVKQYYKDTPFYETADGKWLLENAWRYGFVFRFPIEGFPTADTMSKSYKTGVSVDLNLYRYVGKAHAAVMNHLDLCLEEYIEYLQEHPHIAVFEDGVKRYEITYQKVGDDVATFSVDINRLTNNYTMSLDNFGGVVTAYEY